MRLYDVTLPLSGQLPGWPGDPSFDLLPVASHAAGDEVQLSALHLGTHTGTHLDAPRHLFPTGDPVDCLPLDVLVGEAWVCQLPSHIPLVTAQLLEEAAIPDGTRRLLLGTGNALLLDHSPWTFSEQYVALSPDAADWVVGRGIALLGIDYLSVDPFNAPGLPAHRILLSHQVVVVESLDLRGVPEGPYHVYCLPLRLEGGDGAPARVLAAGGT